MKDIRTIEQAKKALEEFEALMSKNSKHGAADSEPNRDERTIMEFIEIKKPTTAGTYYYKGASNWLKPRLVVIQERVGELVVLFSDVNLSLAGTKLNSNDWPADSKWFSLA